METEWNPKKQIGELALNLRGMKMGSTIMLPYGIKVGAVAVGRRGASKERQFAVVANGQRVFKRSATEAASLAMKLHSDAVTEAAGLDD